MGALIWKRMPTISAATHNPGKDDFAVLPLMNDSSAGHIWQPVGPVIFYNAVRMTHMIYIYCQTDPGHMERIGFRGCLGVVW